MSSHNRDRAGKDLKAGRLREIAESARFLAAAEGASSAHFHPRDILATVLFVLGDSEVCPPRPCFFGDCDTLAERGDLSVGPCSAIELMAIDRMADRRKQVMMGPRCSPHIAAIIKGMIESDDESKHFGSTLGLSGWMKIAESQGLLAWYDYFQITNDAEDLYCRALLGALPPGRLTQWPHIFLPWWEASR